MTDNYADYSYLLKYPKALGRICFVIMNNIYCIPTYVIWMGLLIPIKRFNEDMYYKIESVLYSWLLAMVSMWSYTAGYKIVELGDDVSDCLTKRTLVIANHQSTADVPLLMQNFNGKEDVLPHIMWIMDRLFKFTNFGVVSVVHEDFFITAGKSNRDASLAKLKLHMKNSFLPRKRKWLILFPEGGFLRKRKEISHRFARKNNLPLLEYVTLPRAGALKVISDSLSCVSAAQSNNPEDNTFKLCEEMKNANELQETGNSIKRNLDELYNGNSSRNNEPNSISSRTEYMPNTTSVSNFSRGEDQTSSYLDSDSDFNLRFKAEPSLLDYILDVTIAYPNGQPLNLLNIVHGFRDPCKTFMLYRVYKFADVPRDDHGLTTWLYDRFIEKDKLLENFYRTGQFYKNRKIKNAHVIEQDVLRNVLINIFFITSTYFHYQLITSVYAFCIYLVTNN